MKYILSFFFLLNFVYSQQTVQIGMGASYQSDIFYSFEDGITAFPERENWELAFSVNDIPNIRINSGSGITLFEVSNNINEWSQINILPNDAKQLRNSNTNWNNGAFVVDENGNFDSNWIISEDTGEQFLQGSKVYIINYNQETKKVKINSYNDGVYNLTIANLDNSNEQNIQVDSNDFIDKKFAYYSISNNELIDREPFNFNWDILFTRYEEEDVTLNNETMPYIVTGVLTNNNRSFEFDGSLDINPELNSSNFIFDINNIGYDWKEYSGVFTMVPNRSYYIFNQSETNLYKLIFNSFSGQASGNLSFNLEEIEYNQTSLMDNFQNHLNIFPNPNNGNFDIRLPKMFFSASIFDLNGQLVINKQCDENCSFDLNNHSKGIYLLKLISNNINLVKKIIVE